ncbi:S-layer homology domain-containing protein [Ruminococcaceae bacterium AM07-15]|nr:S-layer homology domain-containing protein [Ruminococcaceae bacterium AM07-15]
MKLKKHLAAILAATLSLSMIATSASAGITIAVSEKTEIEFTSGSPGSPESTGIFGSNGKVEDKSTLPTWELSDGVLIIRGSGGVYFPRTTSPFLDNDYIETVIIEDGITYLSGRLFHGNDNLENLISLGSYAPNNSAYECPNLKNIVIGANLSQKGAYLYNQLDISLKTSGEAYKTNPVIVFRTNLSSVNAIPMDYDLAVNQAADMIAAMDLPERVWDILPNELRNGGNQNPTETTVNAKVSTWAQDTVNQAAQQGFIPAGTLGNDYTQNITRAQFSAIAVQVYEQITGDVIAYASTDFKDSKGDTAVAKAYTLGILTGYNYGDSQAEISVGPNDPITREQAAVMLARLGERLGLNITSNIINMPFTDEIASWAGGSVQGLYNHGIMTGISANTFGAKNPYTIEQSLVTMIRLADKVS